MNLRKLSWVYIATATNIQNLVSVVVSAPSQVRLSWSTGSFKKISGGILTFSVIIGVTGGFKRYLDHTQAKKKMQEWNNTVSSHQKPPCLSKVHVHCKLGLALRRKRILTISLTRDAKTKQLFTLSTAAWRPKPNPGEQLRACERMRRRVGPTERPRRRRKTVEK